MNLKNSFYLYHLFLTQSLEQKILQSVFTCSLILSLYKTSFKQKSTHNNRHINHYNYLL